MTAGLHNYIKVSISIWLHPRMYKVHRYICSVVEYGLPISYTTLHGGRATVEPYTTRKSLPSLWGECGIQGVLVGLHGSSLLLLSYVRAIYIGGFLMPLTLFRVRRSLLHKMSINYLLCRHWTIIQHQHLKHPLLWYSILRYGMHLYIPHTAHLYPPRNDQTLATMHKATRMSLRCNMTGHRVLVRVC